MQRNHDPRGYVPTMNNGDILNLFRHPEEYPAIHIDTNTPLMGGIWQSHWRQTALLNTGLSEQELLSQGDIPSVIRAMYIAEAAGYHAWWDIMTLDLQFHHFTPTGRNFTEWVAEANAAPGQNLQDAIDKWEKDHQHQYAKAVAYLERHPEDGQKRYQLLKDIANDTLQTGQHFVYTGLYLDLPDLLAHGRKLIDLAQAQLYDHVSDSNLDDEIFAQATAGETPGRKAVAYVELIVRTCTTGNPTDKGVAREFAANAYTVRWATRAGERNMERLSQLGNQGGGITGKLRLLSDEIFWDRKYGFTHQAITSLAHHLQDWADQAFSQLESAEETLAAIAFGQHLRTQADRNTPEPQGWPEDILSCLTSSNNDEPLIQLSLTAKSSPSWEEFYEQRPQ